MQCMFSIFEAWRTAGENAVTLGMAFEIWRWYVITGDISAGAPASDSDHGSDDPDKDDRGNSDSDDDDQDDDNFPEPIQDAANTPYWSPWGPQSPRDRLQDLTLTVEVPAGTFDGNGTREGLLSVPNRLYSTRQRLGMSD